MGADGKSSSYFRIGDNIELWRVVVYLCMLIAMVMVLEQIMHKTEHALQKYPKYHEMLTKIYRELMILGLLGLGIKFVKELGVVDGYGKNLMAFQVADLIVFISAFALIIQAIGVFSMMRAKNKQMDRDELVSSPDLIELVKRHQAILRQQGFLRRLWPWTSAPAVGVAGAQGSKLTFSTARYDEMVTTRTLRHFFLRKHGLPELFPFSKYLRQAQDHQITHMIDIEMSMWILLIAITWGLDESTQLVEGLTKEIERYALVAMFLVFAWALALLHLLVAWYLRSAVKSILAAAGYHSHADMLQILQMVADEETHNLETQKPDQALSMMHVVQERHESKEHNKHGGGGHAGEGHGGGGHSGGGHGGGGHGGGGHGGGHDEGGHGGGHGGHDEGNCFSHDTGFQVVAMFARGMCGKKHHGHEDDDDDCVDPTLPKVQIRFFNRLAMHFVVKFLIMLNGFYFAFMCMAILYEMGEISTVFGVLAAIMVPTPLLINMLVFQPRICRNFVLVSCIFKVDVATLSEVITHFSESVELRADFVMCLKQSMRDNHQTVEELHAEFLARDPARTGYIELEEMRQVLRAFGCQISFFRFNGIAKLLFRLKGTMAEYVQIERLLTLAEEEDRRTQAAGHGDARSTRYMNSIMIQETETHKHGRFSVASSRMSEDVVMLESFDHTMKKTTPLGHHHNQPPSEEHVVQVTGRFGLPRFPAQQPSLPPTMENGDHQSPATTGRNGGNGGPDSVKGGHRYHPA
jgi:hypothetical protein